MEKKTIVDQVEVKRDGTMQIRFRKILEDDDGTITDLGYHRTAVMPGDDIDAQLASVDNHLQGELKAGGLPQAEKDFINEVKDAMWTPERIEAKQIQRAARLEDAQRRFVAPQQDPSAPPFRIARTPRQAKT